MLENRYNLEELFDNYLLGKLSQDEKIHFENLLNTDPKIKDEYEFHKLFIQSYRRIQRQKEIGKELDDILLKNKLKSRNSNKTSNKWPFIILVSLIVISGIFIISNRFKKNENREILRDPILIDSIKVVPPVADLNSDSIKFDIASVDSRDLEALSKYSIELHLDKDFNDGINRTGDNQNNVLDTLTLARRMYINKEWKSSVMYYRNIADLNDYNSDFAKLGIAYYKLGLFSEAISVFKVLSNSAITPEWRIKAKWYLSLIYLARGEQNKDDFEKTISIALKSSDLDQDFKRRFTKLENDYINLNKR